MDVPEIPANIRQKANDIMDNACLPERFIECGLDSALRHDIAAALLAERERCAKVAEAVRDKVSVWDDGEYAAGQRIAADSVAEAIRA